ncbi:MAG TPA: type II toxin-antitoxin system VapC family toxin [Candidatus Saccharimonadales bacterium]|nr:type II toxin-antitoxin system VapC family toxin [Candidatus Saccharimonadales bacterium]
MILLDTHVLVWAVAQPKLLSKAASAAIARAHKADGIAISDVSLWELAMLMERGRIQSFGTLPDSLRIFTEGVIIKPITPEIAAQSVQFSSPYPQDPADRLIGATARIEGLPLVTRDEKLRAHPQLQTIW